MDTLSSPSEDTLHVGGGFGQAFLALDVFERGLVRWRPAMIVGVGALTSNP